MADEKERVRWLASELPSVRRGGDAQLSSMTHEIVAGAGHADDCAVVHLEGVADLVAGSDYVRGPKFTMYEAGFLSLSELGWFCVTANVSDLAAMGAVPLGFLAVVRYPKEMSDEEFRAVMLGIDASCQASGIRLIGGDTGSAERLILSGAAFGLCEPGRALRRDAAEPGDIVAVTGRVGGAGAAVALVTAGLQGQLDEACWRSLLDCWRKPSAHVAAGRALAGIPARVACQDVSDGLQATVREIGEASEVSIVLDLEAVPMQVGLIEAASLLQSSPTRLAISASTDFCLTFACHPDDFDMARSALRDVGHDATIVGRCEPGQGVWTEGAGGQLLASRGEEWRHQAGDIAGIIEGLREG